MNKLSQKPKSKLPLERPGRFSRFYLLDNPFPAEPAINKDAADRRINGSIYEAEIRSVEYNKIRDRFLKQPQANLNHIRLGYIIDKSFVGRGNGKSAFLVYLRQQINENFCLDISDGVNKCFALYVTPEIGGRTRTFSNFADVLFESIIESNVIETSLASLRLEALTNHYPDVVKTLEDLSEDEVVRILNDEAWFTDNHIDNAKLLESICENEYLRSLPAGFPLFRGVQSLISIFIKQNDFRDYYKSVLKRPAEKFEFLLSSLVQMFLAAGFNGAYVLVDNFEQIAIPQSARQKLDFAFELRSALYDGSYTASRLGFYNFLLTFHVGVQRLIAEAWTASGMERRSPISSSGITNHVIPFEKLSAEHVRLLLKKYLSEYRMPAEEVDPLYPFKMDAIGLIGELSEFNASSILRTANGLLEKLADTPTQEFIDSEFVRSTVDAQPTDSEKTGPILDLEDTIDLKEKTKNR